MRQAVFNLNTESIRISTTRTRLSAAWEIMLDITSSRGEDFSDYMVTEKK